MVETTKQSKPPAKARKRAEKLSVPKEWPADKIVIRKVADLVPYARNARTHSAAQVDKLAALIREFGFTNPVIIKGEDGTIGAGHGRVLALQKLGYETVPTIEARGWSEEKFRAYVLADNRSALDAGWDDEMLAAELSALSEADFDLSLTAFDDGEIGRILSDGLKEQDEDETPPKPSQEYTVSRPADVWVMGSHRLIVGSCTDKNTVERLLDGVVPGLMVTDPPYGVNYDPDWRNKAKRADGKPIGAKSTGKVQNDDEADWTEAWALFKGEVAYVWHASAFSSTVEASLLAVGFEIRSQIIWNKPAHVIGRGSYHWKHEPAWYAVRKGKNANWLGGRDKNTVWDVEGAGRAENATEGDTDTDHGTQKPVELYRRSILNHTNTGQAVYDPFAGSGTIFVAAEVTGRVAYGCEIDTAYADVIVERWQQLTGKVATLLETGDTFEQTRTARKA